MGDRGEILDCSAAEVVCLIAAADGEIASQLNPAEILIVEDEALIALHLEALVKSLGHTVVGLAATCKEAVALAEHHRPQLILTDIQLSDGSSGLDAVNENPEPFRGAHYLRDRASRTAFDRNEAGARFHYLEAFRR